ncbi:MAG: acyl-CoA desaturase [Myxococcales bacterium]|jgi:stearoyl-CoA desaturase (delta-9 desaturase)|nr:acyl-CoA desaturase [Myxococcales bacterium]
MSEVTAPSAQAPSKYNWVGSIPFFLSHVACLGAIWSGVTLEAVLLGVVLLAVRTFGVTGGYHRYFSHRAYKTSRVFQFILAWIAQSSAQKGVLWWAAHHRVHHKYSDQPGDVHSPVQRGFWYAHVGWILDDTAETRWDKIQDFAKYPELRFLNRFYLLPPIVLAVACYFIAGWPGLFVGFFWSTTLLWHNTFLINSLTHIWGKRRYDTTDDSRNNFFTALLTFGEGWHNNHHHYQSSARNGFYWWEVDITYYILKVLSWFGIVWDLRPVPERVLEEGRRKDRERVLALSTSESGG